MKMMPFVNWLTDKGKKAIFIADRNYESYNGFEHVVQSGNKYLIRVRIFTQNQITESLGPFTDDEFDIDVFRSADFKTKQNDQSMSTTL